MNEASIIMCNISVYSFISCCNIAATGFDTKQKCVWRFVLRYAGQEGALAPFTYSFTYGLEFISLLLVKDEELIRAEPSLIA